MPLKSAYTVFLDLKKKYSTHVLRDAEFIEKSRNNPTFQTSVFWYNVNTICNLVQTWTQYSVQTQVCTSERNVTAWTGVDFFGYQTLGTVRSSLKPAKCK